ncbi:MAG: hypothetical protein WCI73_20120, partial [Phycisphaerae bacterium]
CSASSKACGIVTWAMSANPQELKNRELKITDACHPPPLTPQIYHRRRCRPYTPTLPSLPAIGTGSQWI